MRALAPARPHVRVFHPGTVAQALNSLNIE